MAITASQAAVIRANRERIKAMLVERASLEGQAPSEAPPSAYWSDVASYFTYMLDLPEKHYDQLRVHTFHLTGDGHQLYFLGDPRVFRKASLIDAMCSGLPSDLHLNEPADGIGFRYDDDRFISRDIVTYQQTVSSLFRRGLIERLRALRSRSRVLEIGGGYGGMAHHMFRILPASVYCIVDLPESLVVS
jgi:hypothetical protein